MTVRSMCFAGPLVAAIVLAAPPSHAVESAPMAAPALARQAPLRFTAPPQQVLSRTLAADLAAANASTERTLAILKTEARTPGRAPGGLSNGPKGSIGTFFTPPPCDRKVVKVDNHRAGQFQLQPGQNVLVKGCFGDAPPGQVRINGQFAGGHLTLDVIEWASTYVYGRVPAVSGVLDQDIAVQVRFGDGGFSNELAGSFRATRKEYTLDDPAAIRDALKMSFGSFGAPHCHMTGCASAWADLPLTGVQQVTPPAYQNWGQLAFDLKLNSPRIRVLTGFLIEPIEGEWNYGGQPAPGYLTLNWIQRQHESGSSVRLRFDIKQVVIEVPAGFPPY